MRVIKFKAKTLDGKKWVYGNLIVLENGCHYIFNRHFIPTTSVPSEWFIEVIPETVCQFTGLKDKNSNDVYKSDTVKHVRDYSLVDCFNEDEDGDIDRIDTIIGKFIFTKTKGFHVSGYKYSVDMADIEKPKQKYLGMPSMISTYAEITGNIHD
jgi:hypothetical protein